MSEIQIEQQEGITIRVKDPLDTKKEMEELKNIVARQGVMIADLSIIVAGLKASISAEKAKRDAQDALELGDTSNTK